MSLVSLQRCYTVDHSVRNRLSLLNISRKSTWHGHNWLWCVLSFVKLSQTMVWRKVIFSHFTSVLQFPDPFEGTTWCVMVLINMQNSKIKALKCTEVNYSGIQRSQVAELSCEKILTHLNTLYESCFSQKCQKQVFLIEYF